MNEIQWLFNFLIFLYSILSILAEITNCTKMKTTERPM